MNSKKFKENFILLSNEYFNYYMINPPLANFKARQINKMIKNCKIDDKEKLIIDLTCIAFSNNDCASLNAAISLFEFDKKSAVLAGKRHLNYNSTVQNTAKRWLENIKKGYFR
jgi:hypothetical protein